MRFLIIIMLFIAQTAYAGDNIEKTGDALQYAVPTIAYIATFCMDDAEGQRQFYKSFATNLAVVYALKFSIDKERPNGGGLSFPSGHTAAAFQGAGFIHKRYGARAAILPYMASAFVGYSRIESNHHDLTDVLCGAAIGIAVSWCLTDNLSIQVTSNSLSLTGRF